VSYLFITDEQRGQMLDVIGAASVEELLTQIPAHLQLGRPLELPPPLSELELATSTPTAACASLAAGSMTITSPPWLTN
jgi:glycine dehydrogenase subunit 1